MNIIRTYTVREDDYEHELTRVLQILDAIQDKIVIIEDHASDLADLEMDTRPEDVLAEIHRLQAIERSKR